MASLARPHELTAAQLSERADGYVALAKDTGSEATRATFRRLAIEYADLAAERNAVEKLAMRH